MKFSDFLNTLYAKCDVVLKCNPKVNSDLCGAYYIPQSREGKREVIFIFEDGVPNQDKETDLYRLAYGMDDSNSEEIKLNIAPDLIFILTTYEEDKNFRNLYPQVIENNVLFEMFDPKYIDNYHPNQN